MKRNGVEISLPLACENTHRHCDPLVANCTQRHIAVGGRGEGEYCGCYCTRLTAFELLEKNSRRGHSDPLPRNTKYVISWFKKLAVPRCSEQLWRSGIYQLAGDPDQYTLETLLSGSSWVSCPTCVRLLSRFKANEGFRMFRSPCFGLRTMTHRRERVVSKFGAEGILSSYCTATRITMYVCIISITVDDDAGANRSLTIKSVVARSN